VANRLGPLGIVGVREARHAMTSADGAPRRGFLAPYGDIFAIPRAWQFCVAGIIGRLPMATYGLGTVLLISAVTGHYGVAGSVAAAGALGGAACAPPLGALTDRIGQRRVLVPVCLIFALAVAGLVAAVELRAPDWTRSAAGTAGGAAQPQLGPMARARWSLLLGDSPRLHTAFSVESVADELCYVIGPAAVTILATQVHPAAGVVTAAVSCLVGSLWFASQRGTEPPCRPRREGGRGPGARRDGVRGDGARGDGARLAAPALLVVVPAFLCVGAMFISIDLSTVAFASATGHKSLAGLVLATYALGSGTGGLWYGARTWRTSGGKRLAITLTMTVLGVCTFWAMPSLAVLTPVIFVSGLTIAPTLIAGFSLLEQQALPGRTTEAMAWLSTAISVGVAIGATAAGFLLDAVGRRGGYAFAAGAGLLAVVICLSGLRRLSAPARPGP
jgi:predicted MFS family arabinose efflux permease